MTDEFRVSPDALAEDAEKWTAWSADLSKAGESIPLLVADLDPLAFSILPNAPQVAAAYGRAAHLLKTAMDTGVEQFAGFATTLTFAVSSYREAERDNLADIARSTANLESL